MNELNDTIDILKLLQKETEFEVCKALIDKITLNEFVNLSKSKHSLFLITDFLLMRQSLCGENKTYKDFRDDFRILFTKMEKSIVLESKS